MDFQGRRLARKRDIQALFQGGRSARHEGITMRWRKNDQPLSRFAIVVSKKVSPKAVVRNRMRRIVREAVRKQLPDLQEGYDIAFIVLPGNRFKKEQDASEAVNALFKKAAMVKRMS